MSIGCSQRAVACAFIVTLLGATACTGPVTLTSQAVSRGNGEQPRLVVSVAASAKDAVSEIADAFRSETGVDVQVNAGPSSGLANQILSGAPADIFVSANEKWTDAVAEAGRSVDRCPLLKNRLVLITPKNNPAGIQTPDDLLMARVKKIALAGERVPAGIYADQALRALGLDERLLNENKIVRGQDVRVTLSYVERGEVDAGIVYATDARITQYVDVVYVFQDATHDPIIYPAMLLDESKGKPSARRFYEYLRSADAKAVFEKYGFGS
ncbi:MAG: molybdate ABC transporter substrate-binding protein [Pirellulales bacterium]